MTNRCEGWLALTCATLLAALPASAAETILFDTPGASPDLAQSLRAASPLLAAEREDRTDTEDYFAAARAEYAALLATLYANAHYSPVISVLVDGREAASLAPLDSPPVIRRIVVTVDPGPPFLFSRAEIAPLAPGTVLPSGYAVGEPAGAGVIRDAAKTAVDGWRAVGHAKAAPGGQSLTVNHATDRLAAAIRIEPGPQLRFGTLTVKGQDRMREERIRAIAGFPQGKVFDPAALRRSAERLRRTGVFRSVSLTEAEEAGPDGSIDITATVVEELPRRFGYGAEISSQDGLDLSAYWMHRNLFGGAERLRFDAAVENIGSTSSNIDYRVGVTLDRPATFTPDTLLGISATAARLDNEFEVIDLATLGLTATQFVSDRLTLRGTFEFRAENVSDSTGDYEFRNVALPLGFTLDERNDKFNTTRGYFVSADVAPFLGFDGTGSGARVTADARAYRAIGEARPVVLAGRLQLGSVYGADITETPRDYLFYSGGAGTVRGQPYQSLGVNVIGGDQITGGSRFLAASIEVRATVTEKIGIVGFYDAGSVGVTDFVNDPEGGWQSGAGIGLRYATGFGPIRVDVAAPVSGDTGNGVQIYVGIGQAF